MTDPVLYQPSPGVAYETVPGRFGGLVRPACPLCPWRGRALMAGTWGWAAWIAHDLAHHPCTATPDQEMQS